MKNTFDIKEQKLRAEHDKFVEEALATADDWEGFDATQAIAEHAAKTEAKIKKIDQDRLKFQLYHGQ